MGKGGCRIQSGLLDLPFCNIHPSSLLRSAQYNLIVFKPLIYTGKKTDSERGKEFMYDHNENQSKC